jgi:hypothetical protein
MLKSQCEMPIYQGNQPKDVLNQTGPGFREANHSSEEGEFAFTVVVEHEGF